MTNPNQIVMVVLVVLSIAAILAIAGVKWVRAAYQARLSSQDIEA